MLKLQYFGVSLFPIFRPPDVKNWLLGKDPDAGKDWRQKEKGSTEDEMVGWHHWLNGHECEQAPGVGDGQGSLVCCSPWGRKSWTGLSDWTKLIEQLTSQNVWGPGSQMSIFQFSIILGGVELFFLLFPLTENTNTCPLLIFWADQGFQS